MVKVNWTQNAIQDLNDIGDYISKDSIRYSELTVEKLFNSLDILEQHPFAGKMVLEFEDETIRELIRGNYRIVYNIIDDAKIEILTVNNCARLITNSSAFLDED